MSTVVGDEGWHELENGAPEEHVERCGCHSRQIADRICRCISRPAAASARRASEEDVETPSSTRKIDTHPLSKKKSPTKSSCSAIVLLLSRGMPFTYALYGG